MALWASKKVSMPSLQEREGMILLAHHISRASFSTSHLLQRGYQSRGLEAQSHKGDYQQLNIELSCEDEGRNISLSPLSRFPQRWEAAKNNPSHGVTHMGAEACAASFPGGMQVSGCVNPEVFPGTDTWKWPTCASWVAWSTASVSAGLIVSSKAAQPLPSRGRKQTTQRSWLTVPLPTAEHLSH